MKRFFFVTALALSALAATVVACSDDDDKTGATPGADGGGGGNEGGTQAETGTGEATGSLKATVTYDQAASGKMSVSATVAGTEDFSGSTTKQVTFPGTFELPPLANLKPGKYDFFARLSLTGAQEPQPEDLVAFEEGVDIKAGEEATLTFDHFITFAELTGGGPPGDGGADGGDGGT